ncbi:collagen alpha-1(XVII) chain-like [Gadus macrocephalus]|uniref:collagen alpha-1(XVII) chain-like n=1 Tax=Gadus macrocephalus TaxID=80720 RepID=UPI0028CB7AC6|nr:collagen alpha-1(XVII) chain-like [Gadus macrocephalus]
MSWFLPLPGEPSMLRLVTVCLLLLPGLGWAQSSQQGVSAPGPHGSSGPPHTQDPPHFLRNQQAGHLTAETSYLEQGSNRVGLFVVAAVGTMALMVAVFCIYNRFYSRQQYQHTQLQDHSELTLDPPENPPMMFLQGPLGDGRERPGGYGSLSATPSVISLPPKPPGPPGPPRPPGLPWSL